MTGVTHGGGAGHTAALPSLRLALASQSPARLATLRAAGVDPLVQVSHVDEAVSPPGRPSAPIL